MGGLVCNSTTEDQTITEVPLWNDGLTFHHLCLMISGSFAIFAAVVSFGLLMNHATHYSKPIEQRHIIRIIWMLPIYSSVAWLSIYYYKSSVYFNIVGYCYEAFAISAFFTLLCQYIAPDLHSQKEYFRAITPKKWIWPLPWLQKCSGGENGIWRTPRSGLTWFNVIWVGIFQYCLMRVLMTIIGVITQHFGVYCEETLNPQFAYVWILGIDWIAVCVAMYCLVQFYVQIKETISSYSPFMKLLCIKLVIFLSFWQSSIISLLCDIGLITANSKIQSPDLTVTLPNVLICIEMALISILHLWSYPWEPYTKPTTSPDDDDDYNMPPKPPMYQGGRWGLLALVDCFNPLDLVQAIARSIRWMFVGRKSRTLDPSYFDAGGRGGASGLGHGGIALHVTDVDGDTRTHIHGGGGGGGGGSATGVGKGRTVTGRYGSIGDEDGRGGLLSHAGNRDSAGSGVGMEIHGLHGLHGHEDEEMGMGTRPAMREFL
ncbi:DUF300-domain-containing protein [Aspergillus heteromorphus CBS 117.55]|uniref:DUF300-domain-containing protein n=1 Tax=Aspergillus heteromorphus CBS 117.55 TaxID=1448321 RepID=A0A317VCH8_9EURO|nr:DUF300-domain-containing protein [Aspergillus heteromorphus CBS 117.55]PWY71695.1 DUF300-domain-containing protein [Aspergillus heteromorphus CBS 117.55]